MVTHFLRAVLGNAVETPYSNHLMTAFVDRVLLAGRSRRLPRYALAAG
ncbi:hypothetical protein [Marinobacterium zhoushanense]|nr:hypothetical protein [Marinobacterium zhoushanense]